jgi:hypothetical protein
MSTSMSEMKSAALAADERRYQALYTENLGALDAMLVDEYVHIHANGKVDDKAIFIGTLKAGKYRFISAERTAQRVRVFGTTVLLDGLVATTILVGGESKTISNAFTTVWSTESSEWHLLHWQATKLAEA